MQNSLISVYLPPLVYFLFQEQEYMARAFQCMKGNITDQVLKLESSTCDEVDRNLSNWQECFIHTGYCEKKSIHNYYEFFQNDTLYVCKTLMMVCVTYVRGRYSFDLENRGKDNRKIDASLS
jgi:hypothetical protein